MAHIDDEIEEKARKDGGDYPLCIRKSCDNGFSLLTEWFILRNRWSGQNAGGVL